MLVILKKIPRKVLLATVLLVLGGSALYYLAVVRGNKSPISGQTELVTSDGRKVNLGPATEEEKSEAENNKDEIIKRNEQLKNSDSSSTSSKQLNVVITEVSATELRAYVSGVFEEGGSCTATATYGAKVITGSSTGFQNVSYTQCAPINWSLGPGTWVIKVTYKSSSSEASGSITKEIK